MEVCLRRLPELSTFSNKVLLGVDSIPTDFHTDLERRMKM